MVDIEGLHTGSPRPIIPWRKRRLLAQLGGVIAVFLLGGWITVGSSRGSRFFNSIRWSSPASNLIPAVLTKTNPLEKWGLDLSSNKLLSGLMPWPENPSIDESNPPLSNLGYIADITYKLGPLTLEDYTTQLLNFIDIAMPEKAQPGMKDMMYRYLSLPSLGGLGETDVNENTDTTTLPSWDNYKVIWQTDKVEPSKDTVEMKSWKNGNAIGWKYDMVSDKDAYNWISDELGGTRIELLWNILPVGILRSDMVRYLLLYIYGGIYSDVDTVLLKYIGKWGRDATLYKDGQGWVTASQKSRLDGGESVDDVLGTPSVIVGLEADVGERPDWADWWPRPISILQWTIGAAQYHPIALNALLRILHNTAKAVDWAHDHAKTVKILKDLGKYKDSKNLAEVDVMFEPHDGGPLGVVSWTGPGVWTDAVLSYLRIKYNVQWTDLRNIRKPLRIGDVVLLPVTGFSPGVGNFGSKGPWDAEAMVEHRFKGSWKHRLGQKS